jgi:rhamnose utilization protein RhaD (predicted bifunctional aldolase and dehydrogenase)
VDVILEELIKLSHELGREERQLAILGEGNTSVDCGDGTFWIKASGSQLSTIDETGFSRVSLDVIGELLHAGPLTDEQVADGLQKALVVKTHRKPSVETFLHALCYREAHVKWVGHTHPVSINSILCSKLGAEPFLRPIFPDGIVVCGMAPAVIPYVDPGIDLARVVQDELRRYLDKYGNPPKMLLMVNHGLVALGRSSREVMNIFQMADKWARVILGTYALGGPQYMTPADAERIDSRLDEHYRQRELGQR